MSAKQDVAGEFGGLVVVMLALLLLVGAAIETGMARRRLSARTRRRAGVAAVAFACLLLLAGFTSVAVSGGRLGDRFEDLTSETTVAPKEGGGRLFASSSSRGKYWREAFKVFDSRPLEGAGAGAFAVGRLHYRRDASVTKHAHGWIPQTAADLGILGLVVTTLLFLAWLVAALSATNLLPRRLVRTAEDEPLPRRDWDAPRTALVALALVPLVFGLHSLLDWTWFIPEPTAIALIAAGFVAARGPDWTVAEPRPRRDERRRPSLLRVTAALGTLVTAGLVAWAIWQPEASDRATNEALALTEEGRFGQAIAKSETARDLNPLTPDPLLVRASAEARSGNEDAARQSLEKAVLSFPGDPQTWHRLAEFQLGTLDAPEQALETVRAVIYLDPHSPRGRDLFGRARARLREKTGQAQPSIQP
jgi:hypothetical protein